MMKQLASIFLTGITIIFLTSCASNRTAVKSFGGDWKQPENVVQGVKDCKSQPEFAAENALSPAETGVFLCSEKNDMLVPELAGSLQVYTATALDGISNANEILSKQTPKASKIFKKNVANQEGRSQVIALILCALIGVMGIHRFYLGYNFIGVIQLLTLGGFGIWFFIDLIRIILGTLKPKHGEYTEKLSDTSKKKDDTPPPTQTY
jgi:TM2 domain-containing membrane protein YozV